MAYKPLSPFTLASSLLNKMWRFSRFFLARAFQKLLISHPKTARALKKSLIPAIRIIDSKILRFSLKYRTSYSSDDVLKHFSVEQVFQSTAHSGDFSPLVTVLVPNYNHAPYLKKRLDSIYAQTYRNIQVILMDDCSKDESHIILQEYAQKNAHNTIFIPNDVNSGGVFNQWQKGIKLAKGDIIWIAESDDFCSENFLASLVPAFANEAVMLAYAQTVFVRTDETPFWSIQDYLADISPDMWHSPFLRTGPQIVEQALAIKNIIPNVSSALFRKVDKLELLSDPEWKKMRTCGDWVFYLHLLRGGMVYYTPEATNYYRIHTTNTSVTSYKTDQFYQEHETIARCLIEYFRISDDLLAKQKEQLQNHCRANREDYSETLFNNLYSIARARETAKASRPNLLMVSYGMCSGGGETFPITLANIFKAEGYNVTFLDCAQTPRNDAIRAMLRSDIPVVSSYTHLNDMVRAFNIDLIHSHNAWVESQLVPQLDANSPAKLVVTFHGMYETIEESHLATLLPNVVQLSSHIVYTAEKNMNAVRRLNLFDPAKITHIANGLETGEITPVNRSTLGIDNDAFVLTLVSRAIPEKGWAEAVKAVTLARNLSSRNIELILIGDGPVYEQLMAEPNVPQGVHLLGFRPNIRDYFAASDMAFLPTRFPGESCPLVLIDSLFAGTPILASDLGEITRMIETDGVKAGETFPLEENYSLPVQHMAERIAFFAMHPEACLALKQHTEKVAEKFTPGHLSSAYGNVYDKALNAA